MITKPRFSFKPSFCHAQVRNGRSQLKFLKKMNSLQKWSWRNSNASTTKDSRNKFVQFFFYFEYLLLRLDKDNANIFTKFLSIHLNVVKILNLTLSESWFEISILTKVPPKQRYHYSTGCLHRMIPWPILYDFQEWLSVRQNGNHILIKILFALKLWIWNNDKKGQATMLQPATKCSCAEPFLLFRKCSCHKLVKLHTIQDKEHIFAFFRICMLYDEL